MCENIFTWKDNTKFSLQAIKIVGSVLKKLAEGWKRQKGEIFGFGDSQETSRSLSTMNEEKLTLAPINNLDAERQVGSINLELKGRGAKHLQTASSLHVIAKSTHLTEGKVIDKSLREMERKRVVPSIVEAWEAKQEELSKDGLSEKETQSRATDKRRNADLVKLKAFNGPFSSAAEVRAFTASDLPEGKKVERLYIEVRYARDTCVSFPKNSDIFRLLKDYKKLDSKSYGDNLVIYFDKITFRNNVEMSDFENALAELD